MPASTRSTDPMEHLLDVVLKAGDPKSIYRLAFAAAAASTVEDVLSLSKDDLKSLSWTDDSGATCRLPIGAINTILSIGGWFADQSTTDATEFLALTPESLASWRRSQAAAAPVVRPTATPLPAAVPPVSSTSGYVLSPADEFKKSIKRDPTAFKSFSDRRQWNPWHREFRAIANAQGLGDVLDSAYTPSSTDQQALFDVLQSYTFAVFTRTLKEPSAAGILRNYTGKSAGSNEGNAQSLYRDLVKLMEGGMAARTARTKLEGDINRLRLDKNWNKPIVSFLVHFSHKLNDLRELREPTDTTSYGDVWSIAAVDTCLSTHPAMNSHVNTLKSSRDTLETTFASQGTILKPMTFEEYLVQLNSHAITLDATASTRRSTVNQTNRQSNSSGGRGGGRNRGGRGPSRLTSMPSGDVTDPTIPLNNDQYAKLTPEQRKKRYERKQAARATQRQANRTNTTPTSGASPVPSVVGAHADSRSVASTMVETIPPTPVSAPAPGTVLRQMMSNASAHDASKSNGNIDSVSINGTIYRRVNSSKLVFQVHDSHVAPSVPGSLVDGGANGGLISPSDARILETDLVTTADVVGVTADVMESLPIVQAAARIDTVHDGPIIGIFSNYAKRSDAGRTIHSKGQLQSFGLLVDDSATAVGGSQSIVTNEGYVIPLHVRDGLPYLDMSPPTDSELDSLPHVFFTSDSPWDPSTLDGEYPDDPDAVVPAVATLRRDGRDPRVSDTGRLLHHSAVLDTELCVDGIVQTLSQFATSVFMVTAALLSAFPQQIRPHLPDLDILRPNFAWVPVERIKSTLDATTQHYRATVHHPFRKHFKSRFPAANVRRLPEWFSTDTIFSDVPAHDDGITGHGGATMLQLYAGITSHYLAGFPMSSESDMPETFEDFIRQTGAPLGLMSDNAKSETGTKVQSLLRLYCIKDRQSEPHYQHQNPVERRIQDVKRLTKTTMDRVGCPSQFWLLCMLYIISLLNVITNANGVIPQTAVTGEVTDVSAFLTFHFWQEVFYHNPDRSERLGRWVGVAQTQGDALTYLVLTNDTQQVIARSNVRPAKDPMFPNRNARPPDGSSTDGGEVSERPVISSLNDTLHVDPSVLELPCFAPEELLGLTYLHETEDGDKVRAKVIRQIRDRDAENHQNIKFLVSIGNDAYEELVAYNELSDIIERQHQAENNGELDTWTFSEVIDHKGPLNPQSPGYNGCSYNVKVRWTDGSETWVPLNIVGKDDPVTLAAYAKEHNLVNTPGWKFLRRYTRRSKHLRRLLNQARRQSKNNAPRYKFGVQVPRNVKEAYALDEAAGNTLWADAISLEIAQLDEYDTFRSVGPHRRSLPHGYQLIHCHIVFDVKEDGRRKARFVAGGHMTQPPRDSVYSSVASLRSIRIISFLAELNGLELMAADVGNAYLEAYTKEKVAFIAGPEFGPLEGHVMLICKALYGLRSSGARFHEKLADTLRDLNFYPSRADPDVWIRDAGDKYEYVCTYVDDLLVAMKSPSEFMQALQAAPWHYKLKGVGFPKYHLGANFFRDRDGTLCISCQT